MASSQQLLNAVARTTTFTSADIPTQGFKNLIVSLVTTAIGTGNITLTINRKDVGSGNYVLVLSGAAVSTNTTNTYKVTQNIVAAAANVSAIDVLPEFIQVVVTANNANTATYTVGFDLI
jgi:hypothetical protein